MPLRIDDRWLWIGAGIFVFLAAKGIRKAIENTIDLTQVEIPEKTLLPSDEKPPENSISLEALQTLTRSPNPNISNAAISLITSRFACLPNAHDLLFADLNSRDEGSKESARTALKFLSQSTLPVGTNRHVLGLISAQQSYHNDQNSNDFAVMGGPIFTLPLERDARNLDEVNVLIPSEENPVAGWTNVPRERPQSDDVAETERRRRRREAMVLHEGAGNVRETDIIRPTHR